MSQRTDEIVEAIRKLEAELRKEIQRIRIDTYEIRDRKVHFQKNILEYHRSRSKNLLKYLRHAKVKHVLSAPIIWSCALPALLMDLVVSLYQAICFPLYGIPKLQRRDHIIIDRHRLGYLNSIEKLNCVFCGYFNGLISFTGEVAARTEQYWCPIKHASQLKQVHSRYHRFVDYGDSDEYRQNLEQLRRDFSDLENASEEVASERSGD